MDDQILIDYISGSADEQTSSLVEGWIMQSGENMRHFAKVKDAKKLYLGAFLLLTPFIAYFLWIADPLYADLFKTFGMLGGLTAVACLDEKTNPLSYDVAWWKKLLRVVIGVVLAVALKELIKKANVVDIMQISLLIDAVRYFVVVMTVGCLCPLLFRKIKL